MSTTQQMTVTSDATQHSATPGAPAAPALGSCPG